MNITQQHRLLGALALGMVVLVTPVWADSAWTKMHAYEPAATTEEQVGFAPTPSAAAFQLRDQGYSEAQAKEFEQQLKYFLDDDPETMSTCEMGTSKQGTPYGTLSANHAGKVPLVAYNQTQQLGIDLPVIVCTVTGIASAVHWFYSADGYQSFPQVDGPCNNVGVVTPPIVKTSTPKPTNPKTGKVFTTTTVVPGRTVTVPHIHSEYCGHVVSLPGIHVTTPTTVIDSTVYQSN